MTGGHFGVVGITVAVGVWIVWVGTQSVLFGVGETIAIGVFRGLRGVGKVIGIGCGGVGINIGWRGISVAVCTWQCQKRLEYILATNEQAK